MEILLTLLISVLFFLVWFFTWRKLKEKEQGLADLQIEKVRLQTQLSAAEENIRSQNAALEQQKKELEERLKGIGNEFVYKGLNSLRDENEKSLHEILRPFKEKLDKFEAEVRQTENNNVARFSGLKTMIDLLSERHDQIKLTAQNLVEALRGENKTQGNWGEMALQRILEVSGLTEGIEYTTQSSFRDENQQLYRPDVVIHLPGEKQLIIDSKVSLKAFDQYVNEEDPVLKSQALKAHIESIKTHIKLLSAKDYQHLPDIHTLEFVMMFIPLESSMAMAVKEEPGLYEMALNKQIVLVTPSTLLATLKTIESTWKYERQNRNTMEIAEEAGKMYDKFVDFVSDLQRIGKKQDETRSAYESAMKKLVDGTGNLVKRAEKMRKLGAKAKKQLDSKLLLQESEDEENE